MQANIAVTYKHIVRFMFGCSNTEKKRKSKIESIKQIDNLEAQGKYLSSRTIISKHQLLLVETLL